MGSSPTGREFDIEKVMHEVDQLRASPQERAVRVIEFLRRNGKFTNWDLVCFSVEYLASMSGTLEWLMEPVKHLVRLVYLAHYIRFGDHKWLDSSDGQPGNGTDSSGPRTSGR